MQEPVESELSERELEILRLMATGVTNKEIAHRLYISTNTVKVHLRNIFSKLGVTTRTEAAMYAVRAGLVEADVTSADRSSLPPPAQEDATGIQASGSGQKAARTSLLWWVGGAIFLLIVIGLGFLLYRTITRPNTLVESIAPTPASSWFKFEKLPTARYDLAVASYESQIYAIGGDTQEGVTGVVEVFDPRTNDWNQKTAKPLPVSQVGAAVIGGLVYVPGGRTETGSPADVMEVYDPRRDAWEQRAPLPLPLSAYALVAFEGQLYIFGGWDGVAYVNTVYRYDPASDRWTALSPMPTARGFAGASAAGGKIYVLGGYDGKKALTVNEVYLPEREGSNEPAWIPAASMPQGRYAMGVVSVADIIQVVGGEADGEIITLVLGYDPQVDSWQPIQTSALPLPLSHSGVVSVTTLVYSFGGKEGTLPSDQNIAYQPVFTVAIPLVR